MPRKGRKLSSFWAGQGVLGQNLSDKKRAIEEINYPRDVAYTGERRGNDLNAVTSTASFNDKYLNLRASLHMHFVLWTKGKGGNVNTSNLCSIFQRAPEIIDRDIDGFKVIERVSQISCPKMLSNNDKEAMFVEDVEFRNYPKITGGGLFPGNVRSMVRLQLLDSCECFRRKQRLDGFLEFREIGLADADRKVSFVTTGNVVAVENGQLANQVIQSRAQIVNNVSDEEGPKRIVLSYFPVPENYALPFWSSLTVKE